jgi:hypothetical protein
MDDDFTATEDYHYRHIEGFPCNEADQLEEAIAKMLTAQDQMRAAWLEIGAVSLRLRQLARLRHNAKVRQLAGARTAKRPVEATTERVAG